MTGDSARGVGTVGRLLGGIAVVLLLVVAAYGLLGSSVIPSGVVPTGDETPTVEQTPIDEGSPTVERSPSDPDTTTDERTPTDERPLTTPGTLPETAADTPPVAEIPDGGTGENFELVGHDPLLDEHQYVGDESFGIPRGSNGDVTVAGDCAYVGSLIGYQPPLIVDIEDPTDPEVVGPVPDALPGVGNGIEGIEASGDTLVIDHRRPLGGMALDVPEDEPERGLSVWDVSDCREPELVTRHDYGDGDVHALTLWRDPADPDRLLGVQTFHETQDLQIVDLTGCPDPDACDPEVVAAWDLETQAGIDKPSHEAIMSTDGSRIYVAQYGAGVFTLDSTGLMAALRDGDECDPSAPEEMPGDDHCLTVLNPDLEASLEAQPDLPGEWQHTPLKVPDRPYLLAAAESESMEWDDESGEVVYGNCPGASYRLFSIGDGGDGAPAGTVDPEVVGTYNVSEQRDADCGGERWDGDAVASPGWLSPHFPLAFPDVAFSTYYSAGFRAIDISDPSDPVEAGHFFNDPVDEVRWESYGMQGEREYGDDGTPLRQPVADSTHMFAFSYPVSHDGYLIYADVHSGLYVLEYHGPHADQIPRDGTCLPASPGAVEPGYEPCPPYGETDWESTEEASGG